MSMAETDTYQGRQHESQFGGRSISRGTLLWAPTHDQQTAFVSQHARD